MHRRSIGTLLIASVILVLAPMMTLAQTPVASPDGVLEVPPVQITCKRRDSYFDLVAELTRQLPQRQQDALALAASRKMSDLSLDERWAIAATFFHLTALYEAVPDERIPPGAWPMHAAKIAEFHTAAHYYQAWAIGDPLTITVTRRAWQQAFAHMRAMMDIPCAPDSDA